MVLLNDHFGSRRGELMHSRVAEDRQSQLEPRPLGGAVRPVDSGTCAMVWDFHAQKPL
jgi:hypothetical protein